MYYSVGVDAGSVATKGILFNGEIVDQLVIPTGWSPKDASYEVFQKLLQRNNVQREQVKKIIGTGYGRISMPFVDKAVTEITCHAKGAHFLNPETRTILDIGGQDSKVISVDEMGNIVDFSMNDKCAAGTGRFLQVMASTLGIDISELDTLIGNDVKPQPISSMCTVFAESEVISLLAKGIEKESIMLGIVHSIANKASSLISKVPLNSEVAFTGGVAKCKTVRSAISQKIGSPLFVSDNSQLVGALGAAVIAYNSIKL